jgi:soluble calcium-activated nucleotidase 1
VAENKKGLWHSILMSGTLVKDASTGQFSVRWGPEYKLTSAHNEAGRGMELSELVNFNRCVRVQCEARKSMCMHA